MPGWGRSPWRETAAAALLPASASFAMSNVAILSPRQRAPAWRCCPGNGAADTPVPFIAGSHLGVWEAWGQAGMGLAGPPPRARPGRSTPQAWGTGLLAGRRVPITIQLPRTWRPMRQGDPGPCRTLGEHRHPSCAAVPQRKDLRSRLGRWLQLMGDKTGRLQAGRAGLPSCLPIQPAFAGAAFCLPVLGHGQHGLRGRG